jgi:aspartyl-tRNA(Asn)/glutamyl-tRNA(Gln) amidotransferase subunit C
MKNIITEKDVEYVAKLSRLKLKEEQVWKFTEQLNSILKYTDKLNQLDTSNIEPTSHVVPLQNVKRKDIVKSSVSIEEAIRNAPDKEQGYFKVPPIIE